MKTFLLLGLTAAALLATTAHAQFIDIRLSYKAVLDPATGQRSRNFTDAAIDGAIARMNQIMTGYRRGFRFVRVGPVWNVGFRGDTTGPSKWYGTDFFNAANGGALKDQMEVAARNDARYVWDNNAINLYITDGICGGICSFSFESDNIIILGGCSSGDETVQLHEIGHYFSLFHTQGSICGSCGTGPGQCNTPGDDGIFDTLPDLACWGQDEIAVNGLSTPYASLHPLDQAYVDNTFFNIMSYHGNRSRLTYGQLERWSDSASLARRGVTSGRTWFVDDAVCIFQTGLSQCTFFDTGGPFASLEAAVNASNPAGGDIVMLSGVTPADRLTISKPLTLRAPGFPATIGRLP